MLKSRIDLYNRAIHKWGVKAQMEMAQEEATEFSLAVRKQYRKNTKESFDNLIDETADIEIMIEQIQLIHEDSNFRKLVEERKEFKLNRLNERLNNNSFE